MVKGGFVALLLLNAEFGFVLQLRGLAMKEYFTTFDLVSERAFFAMEGIFAVMAFIVGGRMRKNKS